MNFPDEWRVHLGKWVVVRLTDDDPPITVTGELIFFADSGEVAVREEDGFVKYCWPALDIQPAEDPRP